MRGQQFLQKRAIHFSIFPRSLPPNRHHVNSGLGTDRLPKVKISHHGGSKTLRPIVIEPPLLFCWPKGTPRTIFLNNPQAAPPFFLGEDPKPLRFAAVPAAGLSVARSASATSFSLSDRLRAKAQEARLVRWCCVPPRAVFFFWEGGGVGVFEGRGTQSYLDTWVCFFFWGGNLSNRHFLSFSCLASL